MLDLNVPTIDPKPGERLVSKDYKRDFRELDAAIHDGASWKLERRQYFEEQNSRSGDVLTRGDWQEALRLLGERRESWLANAAEDRRRRYTFHRVRVVEYPFTP